MLLTRSIRFVLICVIVWIVLLKKNSFRELTVPFFTDRKNRKKSSKNYTFSVLKYNGHRFASRGLILELLGSRGNKSYLLTTQSFLFWHIVMHTSRVTGRKRKLSHFELNCFDSLLITDVLVIICASLRYLKNQRVVSLRLAKIVESLPCEMPSVSTA